MPNRTVQLQADQADHKTRSGPNCLACVFLQRQKAENENKEGDRKKHQEPFIMCSNLFLEENKAKITKSQGPLEVRCHRIWMSSSKGRTVSIQLTESSWSCSVECMFKKNKYTYIYMYIQCIMLLIVVPSFKLHKSEISSYTSMFVCFTCLGKTSSNPCDSPVPGGPFVELEQCKEELHSPSGEELVDEKPGMSTWVA